VYRKAGVSSYARRLAPRCSAVDAVGDWILVVGLPLVVAITWLLYRLFRRGGRAEAWPESIRRDREARKRREGREGRRPESTRGEGMGATSESRSIEAT
jgi:peptidoglycan/LPS O-acetylase OafA/YrhL